jgi:hypothetical protein
MEEQLRDLRRQMELLEEQIQQQQQQPSSGAPTKGISPNICQRHIDEQANRQHEQGQQLQEQQQQLRIQQQQQQQQLQQPLDESSSSRSPGGVVGTVFFLAVNDGMVVGPIPYQREEGGWFDAIVRTPTLIAIVAIVTATTAVEDFAVGSDGGPLPNGGVDCEGGGEGSL